MLILTSSKIKKNGAYFFLTQIFFIFSVKKNIIKIFVLFSAYHNTIVMKCKHLTLFVIVFLAALFSSFKDPIQKKKITDVNFRYEFYTTQEKTNTQQGRIYHWFKAEGTNSSEIGFITLVLKKNCETENLTLKDKLKCITRIRNLFQHLKAMLMRF